MMNWQLEFVFFDDDTGVTLRVFVSRAGWSWRAFDADGDEFHGGDYAPELFDNEMEARAAAETWYARWVSGDPDEGWQDEDGDA